MGEIQTVTINGREYDRSTGLPVGVARLSRQELRAESQAPKKTAQRRVATTSANIHSTLKTSARIDSRFAQKPLAKRKLAYEKYGAQAEAALERALARKAEATTNKAKTETQQTSIAVPAAPKQAPAIIKPVAKAHIPAPDPVPTRPATTHKQPVTSVEKVTNPNPALVINNSRRSGRMDGFTTTPKTAAVKSVQARSLQHRKTLQPIARQTNQIRHASPNFNIPQQNQHKPFNTESVVPHPVAQRAQQVQRHKSATTAARPTTAPPASVLKDAIVNQTLEQAPKSNYKKLKSRPSKRRTKIMSFASGFVALAIFAGYVTYLNVPNISVRVAAAQAGIDASYPGYQPNGYRLSGPVAYSDGEVKMKFVSRQDDSGYTLRESRSSWNSATLLENYVREASNDDYTISKEKGITVYHYGGDAAWVSGGILYLVNGDTNLTPEEIRRIATSV